MLVIFWLTSIRVCLNLYLFVYEIRMRVYYENNVCIFIRELSWDISTFFYEFVKTFFEYIFSGKTIKLLVTNVYCPCLRMYKKNKQNVNKYIHINSTFLLYMHIHIILQSTSGMFGWYVSCRYFYIKKLSLSYFQ